MASTVILPLDRSEVSEQAIPAARELAGRTASTLVLVSVIEAPGHLAEWAATRDSAGEVIDHWTKQHDEADAYLAGIAAGLQGVTVETSTTAGNPVRQINELAHHVESPVIVMASHGHSDLQRRRLGSVAAGIVQSALCPVIIVRAGRQLPARPFGRLLVALDGSEFAGEALGAVQAVFGMSELDLHLLRVVETATIVGGEFRSFRDSGIDYYIDAMQSEAAEYLEALARELSAAVRRVTWEVRVGAAAEEIERSAVEHDAGLVVLSTHGLGGLHHVLLGSVADRLVRHSQIPLFVVRPQLMLAEGATESPAL